MSDDKNMINSSFYKQKKDEYKTGLLRSLPFIDLFFVNYMEENQEEQDIMMVPNNL